VEIAGRFGVSLQLTLTGDDSKHKNDLMNAYEA